MHGLPNLNVKALLSFIAFMETGSVTAAAAKLGSQQPNVSRLLKDLDLECGGGLFERGGGVLLPTDKARALLPDVIRLFQDLEGFNNRVAALGDKQSNRELRILSFPRCADALLIPSTSLLAQDEPGLKFYIHCQMRRDLFRQHGPTDYDLIVSTRLSEPSKSGQVVGMMPLVAIMPKEHKLAQHDILNITKFEGQDMVRLELGTLMRHITDTLLDRSHVRPCVRAEASSSLQALLMAKQGLGIFVVDAIIPSAFTNDDMVTVPIDTGQKVEIVVERGREDKAINPLVDQLVAMVERRADELVRRSMGASTTRLSEVLARTA